MATRSKRTKELYYKRDEWLVIKEVAGAFADDVDSILGAITSSAMRGVPLHEALVETLPPKLRGAFDQLVNQHPLGDSLKTSIPRLDGTALHLLTLALGMLRQPWLNWSLNAQALGESAARSGPRKVVRASEPPAPKRKPGAKPKPEIDEAEALVRRLGSAVAEEQIRQRHGKRADKVLDALRQRKARAAR